MNTFVKAVVTTTGGCTTDTTLADADIQVSVLEIDSSTNSARSFLAKAIVTKDLTDVAKACLDDASKTAPTVSDASPLKTMVAAITSGVTNVAATAFKSLFVTRTVFKASSGTLHTDVRDLLKTAAAKTAFCKLFDLYKPAAATACDKNATELTVTHAALTDIGRLTAVEIQVAYLKPYNAAASMKVVGDMRNNVDFIKTNFLTSAVKTNSNYKALVPIAEALQVDTTSLSNVCGKSSGTTNTNNTGDTSNSGMDLLSWFLGGLVGSAIAAAAFVGVYCIFLKGDAVVEDKSKK
jgi:hypothetical protein